MAAALSPAGLAYPGLAFLSGVLSLLSPCVLPLLPLVLGGAGRAHRLGGLFLAAGVVVSFVGIGLSIAVLGMTIGLDRPVFRMGGGVLLALFGALLLSDGLHQRFAAVASPVGALGARLSARLQPHSPGGVFLLGMALGGLWTPCAGPTLGAASMLAAQGKALATVTLTMAAFAAGVTLPLVAVGSLSRQAWARWRGPLRQAGRAGEPLLGAACLVVAILGLTGMDHRLQAWALAHLPDWLIDLSILY
jgi:cytochrome c-type biogenesis protein